MRYVGAAMLCALAACTAANEEQDAMDSVASVTPIVDSVAPSAAPAAAQEPATATATAPSGAPTSATRPQRASTPARTRTPATTDTAHIHPAPPRDTRPSIPYPVDTIR